MNAVNRFKKIANNLISKKNHQTSTILGFIFYEILDDSKMQLIYSAC